MRSSASSVLGVARTTSRAKPYSSSPGSASSAVVRKPSDGHEQHRERRRGPERGRVAPGGERVDVGAQLPGVHLPPAGARTAWSVACTASMYPVKGTFASTTTCRPSARVTTRSGRTPAPSSLVPDGLLDEVAVLQQPGHLDHPAQLHLAPAAAHVRRAQRGDQRGGLLLQLGRGLADRAHLLAQLTVGGGAGALDAGEQAVQVVERLVHRLEPGVPGAAPGEQRDDAEGDGGGQQCAEEETGEQGSGVHVRQGAGRVRQFRLARPGRDRRVRRLVVEQPALDRRPPAEAAQAARRSRAPGGTGRTARRRCGRRRWPRPGRRPAGRSGRRRPRRCRDARPARCAAPPRRR